MWVADVNCWAQTGYSIGSPILNHCLTIASDGNITMHYIVKTLEIIVDIIRGMIADQITIDDTVIITGALKLSSSEITTAIGFVQSQNWADVNTHGMTLHTTSTSRSIGIWCGSNYGGYGTNSAWIRCYGGGSGQIRCQYNNVGLYMSINSTSCTAASDGIFKNMHDTYHNPLEAIKTLRPIKFTWKDDDSYTCVGVIIQYVQDVVPEAMDKFSKDGDDTEYLGVKSTELLHSLIAGLQEATQRIEILESLLKTF